MFVYEKHSDPTQLYAIIAVWRRFQKKLTWVLVWKDLLKGFIYVFHETTLSWALPEVPVKKGFLKNSQEDTCVRVFFFDKKRLRDRRFPENFAKFLRTSSLKNTYERLLLNMPESKSLNHNKIHSSGKKLLKQTYHFKFFKGYLPQISLGSFLDTLSHLMWLLECHVMRKLWISNTKQFEIILRQKISLRSF